MIMAIATLSCAARREFPDFGFSAECSDGVTRAGHGERSCPGVPKAMVGELNKEPGNSETVWDEAPRLEEDGRNPS